MSTRLSRRTLLRLAATSTAALTARGPLFAADVEDTKESSEESRTDPKPPITGEANPELAPFDELMSSFVTEQKVPGASLAITHNGRLVYARGFGYSDVEKKEPVSPTALFRIASVSKPFTSVAVMQLAQKGKLKLDDKVLDYITLKPVESDEKPDPRWKQITIRQCLQHTGGWDRSKSYDPIGRPWIIASALAKLPPTTPDDIVRYMLAQPLDFDPGQRYAYSNLGYLVLSRIMEKVTGRPYEPYMKEEILAPLGIKAMKLGRALADNRADGEVKYYDRRNRTRSCLYPPKRGEFVPVQYGAENLEGYEAHGGWIASAPELVRFASAFDVPSRCPLLSAESIEQMWSRPDGPPGHDAEGKPKSGYYACGWSVNRRGDSPSITASHNGFISGSESTLLRRSDGTCMTVLFNTATNGKRQNLSGLIDGPLHRAATQIKAWPKTDQFEALLT